MAIETSSEETERNEKRQKGEER